MITTVTAVSGSITSSFASLGAGTMTLSVTGSDLKTGLSADDLQMLTDMDCLDGVTPTVTTRCRISRGGEYETNITVAGRNPYWFSVNPDSVTRGRALNILDMNGMHFCCLIDQEMIDTFFFGVDPIDRTLYVQGLPFKVVGVFDADADTSVAGLFSGSPDILIPYTTALKLNNTSDVSFGLCRALSATFTVSHTAIALGVGFSALVGIVFGWAPARKASKLNPIDALRRN